MKATEQEEQIARKARTVDEYISAFPTELQEMMQQVREVIRSTAPEATECISWGIPTFKLGRTNLIHFAANRTHLGIYPGVDAIIHFADELKTYKTSKGAIQIPYHTHLPVALIKRIVEFNARQICSH